jgi:hypothetical protein
MSVRFQVAIDCHDARRLVTFWSSALYYQPEPPPRGFAGWREYWLSMGVPEEDVRGVTSPESIVDPKGEGPRIWFHAVPEAKVCKNRLHFDIKASGDRELPLATRKDQVEAEAARLENLGAARLETLHEEGVDHYAVAMADPEGNEFDIN